MIEGHGGIPSSSQNEGTSVHDARVGVLRAFKEKYLVNLHWDAMNGQKD